MGLDMYLNRHTYVGAHKYDKTIKKPKITVEGVTPSKVTYVVEEAMYWRKANAIHGWFVDNVQEGNDNCGTYYVSKEKIKELYDDVRELLTKKDSKGVLKEVKDKLPPVGGFFFGGTEVDEDYWADLEDTKKGLKEILDKKDYMADYYYHSSW